ncbi:MAG: TetR/AcrR family transcriptional regulator [Brevefilum sp.]|nr:TetR/AcrR family transcriptional regulator [Brevefilum sp.]
MARRLDRRVQRTRKLLRESIMALILEEGYDAISIQDITDKANLGRATFYLHFKDKDDLLLDVMDEMIGDFMDQVPALSEAQWELEDSKAIQKLFDFAADHYDLYRILIIGSGGITASRQLECKIAENIEAAIQREIEEKNTQTLVPPNFIANHFAGSLLATIYWWLDNELPYDVEQMASMFQKVNLMDRKTLMGTDIHAAETPEEEKNKKKRREKTKPKRGKEQEIEAAEITVEQVEQPAEVDLTEDKEQL